MRVYIYVWALLLPAISFAQMPKLPSLPTSSGGKLGLQGSIGAGFVDYRIQVPSADFKIDRGIFVAGQIERGFNDLGSNDLGSIDSNAAGQAAGVGRQRASAADSDSDFAVPGVVAADSYFGRCSLRLLCYPNNSAMDMPLVPASE